jgi:hypothetical protein
MGITFQVPILLLTMHLLLENYTVKLTYSGSSACASATTNASNTITVTVNSCSSPIISLSGNLAFGNVQVGSPSQRTLTITNTGTATLNVTSISYPNSVFSGNWSGSISAGLSQDVTVTFLPTSA